MDEEDDSKPVLTSEAEEISPLEIEEEPEHKGYLVPISETRKGELVPFSDYEIIEVANSLEIAKREAFRIEAREKIRYFSRKAKMSANRASTAQNVGVGIGGAVGAGGLLLMASATAPITAPVIFVTGIGFTVFGAGIGLAHIFKKHQISHEDRLERMSGILEDIDR